MGIGPTCHSNSTCFDVADNRTTWETHEFMCCRTSCTIEPCTEAKVSDLYAELAPCTGVNMGRPGGKARMFVRPRVLERVLPPALDICAVIGCQLHCLTIIAYLRRTSHLPINLVCHKGQDHLVWINQERFWPLLHNFMRPFIHLLKRTPKDLSAVLVRSCNPVQLRCKARTCFLLTECPALLKWDASLKAKSTFPECFGLVSALSNRDMIFSRFSLLCYQHMLRQYLNNFVCSIPRKHPEAFFHFRTVWPRDISPSSPWIFLGVITNRTRIKAKSLVYADRIFGLKIGQWLQQSGGLIKGQGQKLQVRKPMANDTTNQDIATYIVLHREFLVKVTATLSFSVNYGSVGGEVWSFCNDNVQATTKHKPIPA